MTQEEEANDIAGIDSYILGKTWTTTLSSYVYQIEHLLAMIQILCGVLCLFQWEIIS